MPDYRDRIHADPSILGGKPVVRGTRIAVEHILTRLAEGASFNEVLEAWPNLALEDIRAALAYSADVIGNEEMLVG
jgi:uncharacterized protein (DUF433 family)